MRGRYAVISVVAAFAATACDHQRPWPIPGSTSVETPGIKVIDTEVLRGVGNGTAIVLKVQNMTTRKISDLDFRCNVFDRDNVVVSSTGGLQDPVPEPLKARHVIATDDLPGGVQDRMVRGVPARWACVLKAKFEPEGPGEAK